MHDPFSSQPETRVLCAGLRAMCTEAPEPPKPAAPKPVAPSRPAPQPAALKYSSAATPAPPSQRRSLMHSGADHTETGFIQERGRYR